MSGLLHNSPAEILGQAIVDDDLGGDASWPVYINNNQKTNTANISVLDTAGFVRGKTQVDSESQEHYGIQLLFRSPSPTAPFQKANEVLISLDAYLRKLVTLGDHSYIIQAVTPSGNVIRVGKEQPEDLLMVYSLNVVASIRLT